MPDELYQRQPSQVGPGLSHHMEPVGFTLADVRRLAKAYADETRWTGDIHAPHAAAVLAPFAALIKEKNGAQG